RHEPVRLRLLVGGLLPAGKAPMGLLRAPDRLRRRFVGRIEPRIGRDRPRVEVLDVWWKEWFAPHGADTGSSTRCATRSALIFASPVPTAEIGHPAAHRRSGSSLLARDLDVRRPRTRSPGW